VHLASIHERVYTNSCTYIEYSQDLICQKTFKCKQGWIYVHLWITTSSTSNVLMCTRCSFPELAGFTFTTISELAGLTFTSRST
jgi:hypothetical protein